MRLEQPLEPHRHRGWISYVLSMTAIVLGRETILRSSEDTELFLDAEFEPEVPLICAGVRRVSSEGGSYFFTPADEKDFELRVWNEGDHLRVRMQFRDCPASDEFGWPVGVQVSRESLLSFVDSLERAYRDLVPA
ncbi:MAG: hypothetical protein KC586_03125 [Myxococcales bacterium]|nr:hypothetical protein [Myxococcales bacterium]